MMKNKILVNRIISRNFFKNFFQNKHRLNGKGEEKTERVSNFGRYEIVEPNFVSSRKTVPVYIPQPSYAVSSKPPEPPEYIEVKDRHQVECMRHSCLLAKRVLKQMQHFVKPGVTTDYLDEKAHELIISNGAYPSPLNYLGFPKSICTSINNVACHGIPDKRPLQDGDLLNIDITVYLNGYHGDCSGMFEVGNVDEDGKMLIKTTELCLQKAIDVCRPNEKFSAIGNVIEEVAKKNGFTVIPAFCGHGIGSYFHGPPDIFHFANECNGIMKSGMTFTIEPALTQGGPDIEILEDGWTAVTVDNARSAQVEHTILITEYGCDVLT